MAVLFSAVTITSDSDQAEFLVAGVPKSYADLEGWTAFESFMNEVDTEQDIKVHVAACLYGEGEVFTATPEEVAYFTIRAAQTDDFFYDHCTDAGHSDFTIPWSPKELFGMEMKSPICSTRTAYQDGTDTLTGTAARLNMY